MRTTKGVLVRALRDLFIAFPAASDRNEAEAEIALKNYLTAVATYSVEDVRSAIALLLQARVEGVSLVYRPTPPQLADACRIARASRLKPSGPPGEGEDRSPRSNAPGYVAIHNTREEFAALERHRGRTIYVPSASGWYTLETVEHRAAMAAWNALPFDERFAIMAARAAPPKPTAEMRKRGAAILKKQAQVLAALSIAPKQPSAAEKAAAMKKHDQFWGLPNRNDEAMAERRKRLDDDLGERQRKDDDDVP